MKKILETSQGLRNVRWVLCPCSPAEKKRRLSGQMGSLGGGGRLKITPNRLRPSQVSGMCPGGAREKTEFHKPVNVSCVLPDSLTPGQEGPQARSCCPDRPEECLTQSVIRTDQLGRTQSRTRDSRAWTESFLTCTHSVVSSPPQAVGHSRSPLLAARPLIPIMGGVHTTPGLPAPW